MSKKKVILSTIALLLVMFVAVSVVSYSIANKGHGDSIEQSSLTNLGAGASANYVTNIDLIIENAVDNGETFNIVEIVPSGTAASDLKAYAENGNFSKYVITANKETETRDMPEDMISYNVISINSATLLSDAFGDGTVQSVLDAADLVYLSSPSYNSYNGTNNLSEELYNYLHVYSSSKPIIMDFVTSSSSTTTTITMGSLVSAISRNHIKFRTYSWTDGLSADDFFSANGSYYLKFNANSKKATGNILVIANTATPGAGSMMNAMQTAGDAAIIKSAYYGLTANIPKKLNYTVKNIGTTALTVADLEGEYDFILIEDGVKDIAISQDVYKKLRALSESSEYILYNSNLATTSTGTVDSSANNYLKLLQMYVNANGVEQVTNVLAISYGYFTSLNEQGADGVEGAKAIADLINNTVYRDSDKTGAAGKKYRVLEIQPCYPIDLELAQKNPVTTTKFGQAGITGGYYTVPDQMLYGVTADEIEEGTEYYAFEISKAKIAYATGLPYNQIEVTQMSTNELISTKGVVLEDYDFVYVGGDSSAYLPYEAINYTGGDFNWQQDVVERCQKGFTAFTMYTHTGNFVDYQWTYYKVGNETNSIASTGNDITTTKRDELKAYVDSGLPIIIDEAVTTAFEESYQFDVNNKNAKEKSRLKQLELTKIDPDSNMYQFLAYAYEKEQAGNSVNLGWGLIDAATDETKVENVKETYDAEGNVVETVERAYGNTLGTQVTVYNQDCSTRISNLIDVSATRPQLSLSKYPKLYIEGNSSTTNTSQSVDFTVNVKSAGTEVTAKTYTVGLYIDSNGDGYYSESEEVDSTTCTSGESVQLSYSLDEDFFGLVNWKVKAVETDGVLCDMASGISFFKVAEDMKKTVRVLQIMPVNPDSATQHIADGHSLYFCTECQQSAKILKNNVTIDSNNNGGHGVNSSTDTEYAFNEVRVGKHEHDFGIVIYDSTTGYDDWETNFADTLTHGDDVSTDEVEFSTEYGEYEFDLDIITVSEFDTLCSDALSRSEDEVDAAAQMADTLLVEYQEALNSQLLTSLGATLETELFTAAESVKNSSLRYRDVVAKGIGTKEEPGQWILDKQYYKFWEYINNGCNNGGSGSISNYASLCKAYNAYIDEYDAVVDLREQYKTVSRQNGDADTWMLNNYDIVVLGLADQFNGMDLTVASSTQLKNYVASGGSVLNSHDTLTAKNNSGAVNLTNALREEFGMDRFHVLGISDDSTEVQVKVGSHATKTIYVGNTWGTMNSVTIDKKDVIVTLDGNDVVTSTEEVGEEKAPGESITVTVKGGNQWSTPAYKESQNGDTIPLSRDSNMTATFLLEQGVTYTSASFNIGTSNVTGTLDKSTGTLTVQDAATEVTDEGLKVDITVTENGTVVADGTQVIFEFRGNSQTVKTVGGIASVYLDVEGYASPLSTANNGSKYRRYITADSSKYFWTERLKAESEADYATVINNAGISNYVKFNAPIGITDLYASYDASSRPTSPYTYTMSSYESYEHSANVNGINFEAKYGTRKAERVNIGGVTTYPFTISNELRISPTHAQAFALDIEDTTLSVWYTLGANYVDSKLGVTEHFARYSSSFYTASPRDGMNNYFLYSKENVFYTGAGHQLVTGMNKDNNDERRLFINVIVNSVTKGVTAPKLKLYNKCDKEGSEHENCDCLYVDPKNDKDNDELAKNLNTLYYNKGIEMYQYNIDESQAEIYPEFDFKAIAGTANIKQIDVFYDLNYGEGDGMDYSDLYTDDDNHVLITSYDKSDNMDGVRARLREDIQKQKLLLKDEYFKNYKDCTYIVIRVRDEKNKWQSARVKINIIPHLFDLTDATSDYEKLPQDTVVIDKFDKKQFNI